MSFCINHRVRQIVSLLLILVLISLTFSCIRIVRETAEETTTETVPGTNLTAASKLPIIISFNAAPSDINPGEATKLEWAVNNATEVSINPEIGGVNPADGMEITPSTSTIYTLTATNSAGTVTQSVTVIVAGTPEPVAPETVITGTTGPAPELTTAPGSPGAPETKPPTESTTEPELTPPPESSPTPLPPTTPAQQPIPLSSPPVIRSFTANPPLVNAGGSSVISWDVEGASSIYLDHGGGYVPPSGFATARPLATTTYVITASNAAGSVTRSVTVTVIVSLPVINYFDASPSSINAGGSSALSWSVSGATSVYLDHGGGYVAASGSATARPSATTTYTLTASNAAGSVTRSVTVSVAAASPPVINYFNASPTSINAGSSSALSWGVSGATSVYLDHGGGYVAASGSATARPSATTTYTLTASNAAGSVTRSVTVSVAAAPASSALVISYFTANPASISAGGSSTLSWSVSGATSISINNGVGSVASSGTRTVSPASTTTYTLTATNAAGSVTRSVTVSVAGAPAPAAPVISSFTASPASINAGGSSTLSWSVSGATSISINNGVGGVASSGTRAVSPASTTTYTLTATNAAGSVTRSVTVSVTAAPAPGVDVASCEQALFNAVNALRTGNGRAALSRNAYIDGLCRQHAQYMASRSALSHDNADSRFNSIMATMTTMHICGENVLQGNAPCNASALAQLWWNSPPHKANILEARFTIAGMGIVVDGSGRIWACQIFAGP